MFLFQQQVCTFLNVFLQLLRPFGKFEENFLKMS